MDKLPTQLTAWKIVKVLQEETDAEHPITQECLRKAIGNVDRKTVYRCLNESMRGAEDGEWFERKVLKNERGSVYYQGDFEPAEIRILIDSLLANKSINPRQSADLIDKLKTLLSKHQQKLLESSQVAKNGISNKNLPLFITPVSSWKPLRRAQFFPFATFIPLATESRMIP